MRILKIVFSRFAIVAVSIILQVAILITLWTVLYNYYIYARIIFSIIGVIILLKIINQDMGSVYKTPWIVLVTIVPVVGITIYALFGNQFMRRSQRKKYDKIFEETEKHLESDEKIYDELVKSYPFYASQSRYLLKDSFLPVYKNTEVEYLPSGEEYYQVLKKTLLEATHYIFLEYFIFEYGTMWSEVESILLKKVQEGVKVYLIYDDIGSISKVKKSFANDLCKKGIHAIKFSPFQPIISAVHNNRDHRKIVVVDGITSITGGVNIADEYINLKHPFGKWKDCGVLIKGEAVRSMAIMFIQNYNAHCHKEEEISFDRAFNITQSFSYIDGYVQPFGDGPRPLYENHVGENAIYNMIQQSQKYLYIETPYLIIDYEMLNQLCLASKRGVDVRIITPHIPDKKVVYFLTKSNYKILLEAGVKIYEYTPGFIHSKLYLSDDTVGIIGTINMDYRSLVHHYENGVWICGSNSLFKMKEDFLNTIKTDGMAMNLQNSKLNPFQKLLKILLRLFAPLL